MTVPTSDERRDIAARLRALPIDTYAVRKEWEEGGLFIDANLGDEADYSQIHNAVFGCFPAEYMHAGDYEELHERLADLIDPTCEVVDVEKEPGGYQGTGLCSKCGELLLPAFVFCPQCGSRVTNGGER